ncbi:(2Fe-2S)-binding protein [Methylomarinum sp. Ch1-1]|uniref:Bacterioferritin-associated ferredoxin n=1 Tax=Methylomarinum roseum TaxID=3067653 RepID=A0AAU7P033_9GAMM|nr:(2Fe-2S)-binding protein [Methylomarinum sp. Ch1-1]MDP4521699.1 (2Fe-2S)-binding protein [Methylomarinum sp. Ch1-1]
MYVCVCKAVTDNQLQAAMNEGLCSRRQLFESFGVGSACGKCNKEIRELINQQTEHKLTIAVNELVA